MNETERQYWVAFGQWIEQRLAEQQPGKWTQLQLRDELETRTGINVKRTWINQVINGKRPSPELRKAIERLLGDFPEPESSMSGDQASLTRAIVMLTDELRAARRDRETLEERLRYLEAAVQSLQSPDVARLEELSAPPRTTG